MRILQLTKKFPYPPKDGESVAILTMAHAYKKLDCSVDLLAFNTKKHFVEFDRNNKLEPYEQVDAIEIDTTINYLKALLNLISSSSYNINRFISSEYRKKLRALLSKNRYDFIQIETLYMMPYIDIIRKNSEAKIVFRSHNLEYEIWQDMQKTSSNIIRKLYYKHASKNLKLFELNVLDKCDLLVPISSSDDKKYNLLGYSHETLVSPVGIDLEGYTSTNTIGSKSQKLKLGYIGSLDWLPNIEGLNWFFKNIWDRKNITFNKFEFHIAGRNANKSQINALSKDVIFHGEVESAKEYIQNLDIVIVPLLSGSGIRVKILESMAMGKIVFSTPKGFEGIPIEDGMNAFIFQNKEEFFAKLLSLESDKGRMRTIQDHARHTIERHFDNVEIAKRIIDKIKDTI